jgi:DNA-binding transcriptional MerR regulator
MSGWIKIHRKFLDWEWFNKSEAVHLFMYLVLKANHKDGQWQGIDIKKGQFITSFGKISTDTGISLQTIRTLLKKFEKSNEINIQTTNKYSVVTICKYECYQKETESTNEQLTNKQQSTNNQLTTNKNDKKEKKEIYIPELSEFLAFAIQECSNINQDDVKHKYKSWVMNEWKDGNDKPIKNWKTKLLNTIPHLKKHEIQKERIIFD